MGALALSPVVHKDTEEIRTSLGIFSWSTMEGFKARYGDSMEDRLSFETDVVVSDKTIIDKTSISRYSYIAVYDGHEDRLLGDDVTNEVAKDPNEIEENVNNKEENENEEKDDNNNEREVLGEESKLTTCEFVQKNLFGVIQEEEYDRIRNSERKKEELFSDDKTLEKSCLKVDKMIQESNVIEGTGATFNGVFIIPKDNNEIELVCTNVGDGGTMIYDRGNTKMLSTFHLATDKEEGERINKMGGEVEFGRTNGQVVFSRSFGDFQYKNQTERSQKEQVIISVPGIQRYTFTNEKIDSESEFRFILCGTNGLWEMLDEEKAAAFIVKRLKEQKEGIYIENMKKRESLFFEKVLGFSEEEEDIPKREELSITKLIRERKGGYNVQAIICELLNECIQSQDSCAVFLILLEEISSGTKEDLKERKEFLYEMSKVIPNNTNIKLENKILLLPKLFFE